mmetsp:Transcript_17005/g.48591  ORF Transcript_17005/g.48591 Transcript_17005/m.48591 type:complete len:202 (+) Transcript_17005:1018-1623(+)
MSSSDCWGGSGGTCSCWPPPGSSAPRFHGPARSVGRASAERRCGAAVRSRRGGTPGGQGGGRGRRRLALRGSAAAERRPGVRRGRSDPEGRLRALRSVAAQGRAPRLGPRGQRRRPRAAGLQPRPRCTRGSLRSPGTGPCAAGLARGAVGQCRGGGRGHVRRLGQCRCLRLCCNHGRRCVALRCSEGAARTRPTTGRALTM